MACTYLGARTCKGLWLAALVERGSRPEEPLPRVCSDVPSFAHRNHVFGMFRTRRNKFRENRKTTRRLPSKKRQRRQFLYAMTAVSGSVVLIEGCLVPHEPPVCHGRHTVCSAFREGTQTQAQRELVTAGVRAVTAARPNNHFMATTRAFLEKQTGPRDVTLAHMVTSSRPCRSSEPCRCGVEKVEAPFSRGAVGEPSISVSKATRAASASASSASAPDIP